MQVPVDGAGEHDFFQVAPQTDQVIHTLPVRDANDVLFDDGAFVQFRGDIVGGGTDDFDAALVRRVIGAAAGKCRQERW